MDKLDKLIEQIKVFEIKPTDMIVVECKPGISDDSFKGLHDQFNETFKRWGIQNKAIIVRGDYVSIGVN